MSKIVKNIIALSVSSALSISFIHNVNAATYQIIDTDAASKLKYTYAQHQNSSGDMAISGTSVYNFPVQFDYLDSNDFIEIRNYAFVSYRSVHALSDIEDFEALIAGNPTANDLAWVVLWLQNTKGTNILYQKVGDTIAMTNVAGVTKDYNLWDEKFEDSDELTRSTIDIVSGITNGKISYGTATAPYLPENFTDSDGEEYTFWLREYGIRGFFSYDQGAQVYRIDPIPLEDGGIYYAGGESAVLDVNEAGIAVGFSSYQLTQSYKDIIEDDTGGCADPVVLAILPFDACVAETQLQSSVVIYHTMAFKATLDPNGVPVVEELGLLVEPHEDDERPHSSYALAVNADGTAVGYASGWNDGTVTSPAVDQRSNYQYAVVYKNGEVIDLTGDHADEFGSRAYDINDAGIAVGHISKIVNGALVQKFFYVDTNKPEDEIELVYPDDFFDGSDSTARAINNTGLIVGEGEVETHNESAQNPRRTAAFVYDMNANSFTNLNNLIPCSKRLTYDIFEARGINDEGMVSASAIVKVDRLDAKGEPMLDDNGSPETEDVVRALSLELIPGGDDGEVCTAEEEGKVERQGASFSFGSLFALFSLFGLRRKFLK